MICSKCKTKMVIGKAINPKFERTCLSYNTTLSADEIKLIKYRTLLNSNIKASWSEEEFI